MRIIEVKWDDASAESGWRSDQDLMAWSEVGFTVTSVGYLWSDEDKYIVLASNYSREHDMYSNYIQIPKSLIRETKILRDDNN